MIHHSMAGDIWPDSCSDHVAMPHLADPSRNGDVQGGGAQMSKLWWCSCPVHEKRHVLGKDVAE